MLLMHPFQQLFEAFGKHSEVHADIVNRVPRERLRQQLEGSVGRAGKCVLLKAPRAGYGKTHILNRLQNDFGQTHEFVSLHAVGGSRIDAETVLDDLMRGLLRVLPASGGLTALDMLGRRLLAFGLQPLVKAGHVPCQDRERALNALETRPIETFDFQNPGAVTAHWARDNFEILGPRLSIELSNRTGLSLKEVSFWIDAIFRFISTPPVQATRMRALFVAVFEAGGMDVMYHDRLVALLGLMCRLMRVVLVADELEGFSSNEAAALRFATFLVSLRQEVESLEIVISLNQDVWKNAFVPRLSGGLLDRLSELVIELEPLNEEQAVAVLESRVPGQGKILFQEMSRGKVPSYSRGLIFEAGNFFDGLGKFVGRSAPVNEPNLENDTFIVVPKVDKIDSLLRGAGAQKGAGLLDDLLIPENWLVPEVGFADETDVREEVSSFLEFSPSKVEDTFEKTDESNAFAKGVNTDRLEELLRQFRERYGKA